MISIVVLCTGAQAYRIIRRSTNDFPDVSEKPPGFVYSIYLGLLARVSVAETEGSLDLLSAEKRKLVSSWQ